MPHSLGSGSTLQFIDTEFHVLDLKDKRLKQQAKKILHAMQLRLGSCVRRVFSEFKEARQAYDFFSNPKVSSTSLLDPHYENTAQRIQDAKAEYILAICDQMRLNFTSHKAKTDLGSIGKSGNTIQYGIIQHSILTVSENNEPFGLIDVSHFDYDDIDNTKDCTKRDIADKVNIFWIDAVKKMRNRLGETDKKIVTVADREGDFYEFLHSLSLANESFIIRAKHNRVLGESHTKGEKLLTTDIQGSMQIEIQDVHSRKIKEINLNLKAVEITIPIPKKMSDSIISKNQYRAITLNVIQAYNEEHEWILLTTLPIETLEQLKKVVSMYRCRWHIEDYHKVLKTGYQADEIYLHTSKEAILNLLTLASISACRLYWLIYIGRVETSIKADKLFEEFEWKSLYVYFNEPIPEECPTSSYSYSENSENGGI